MELEQLRQLDMIAREGTMLAASERLHISQSALSRSVRRLEDELGRPLFDRTRNSMQLNDAGQLALGHARAILAEERRLRDDFSALARQARTLRVASVAPAPTRARPRHPGRAPAHGRRPRRAGPPVARQTPIVEELELVGNDNRHNAPAQALLEQDNPAHAAVSE